MTTTKYQLALVTGATSGIGHALSHLLADQGTALILTGRRQDELQNLQEALKPKVEVQIIAVDLSQREDRRKLIDILHHQAPDLVINNAGFGLYGEALSYATEEQVKILEVNGVATLELTLEAARALVSKDKQGVVVNVSSAAAFHVFPYFAVYAASKAFVNQFSQALDDEMQTYGVRILTACPGMVETHFQERAGGSLDYSKEMEVMTPEFMAKEIWQQIQHLQPLSIINWKYCLATYLSYFLPRSWVTALLKRNIAKRIKPRPIIKVK